MELIDLEVPSAQLADRYFVQVRHSRTGLGRGLELAERVVLQDRDGGYHAATVEAVEFTLDDTLYRVRLGARLPEDIAQERLSGEPLSRDRQSIHDVIDLVDHLRGPDLND
jgi:hypothetical protein